MLKSIAGWVLSVIFLGFGISVPINQEEGFVGNDNRPSIEYSGLQPLIDLTEQQEPWVTRMSVLVEDNRVRYNNIAFTHGDIAWLPALAAEAGWPKETWERLGQIILRESGGCPNRRGGDMVDKKCIITGVSEWNHRSDTGLLQINGVNYDPSRNKWSAICRELNICTQEPLLDPLNNLKAGYILYKTSGWGPWDPCQWGPEYAKRCKADNKKSKP